MLHKILAVAGGVVLVGAAAVGTWASQDAVSITEETPTVTETTEATETPTATPDATETAEPTATEDASETPEATATPDDEDDKDDVHGIPDSNPSKHPENGDGVCEKGETVVKTTPSGTQVNVPCKADKEDKHEDKANKHDEKDADESDDEDEDESDTDDDDSDEDEDDSKEADEEDESEG